MGVRNWLSGLLGGRPTAHVDGDPVDDNVSLHGALLVTARIGDPIQHVPGFRETYFCTRCKDYFVLGWQPSREAAPAGARVVSIGMLPERARLDALLVFCPACRTRFDQYGPMLGRESEPQSMTLRSTFAIRFPTSKPGHDEASWIRILGRPHELALVVSGEFPEGADRAALLGSFVERELASLGAVEVPSSFVVMSVAHVDEISAETPAVVALIRELGGAKASDAGAIFTSPIREGRAPLRQVMLCLFQRASVQSPGS